MNFNIEKFHQYYYINILEKHYKIIDNLNNPSSSIICSFKTRKIQQDLVYLKNCKAWFTRQENLLNNFPYWILCNNIYGCQVLYVCVCVSVYMEWSRTCRQVLDPFVSIEHLTPTTPRREHKVPSPFSARTHTHTHVHSGHELFVQ